MHEMQTNAIDFPGVCQSVSLSVTRLRATLLCRHMVLLGLETFRDQRNIVLDESHDFYHGFNAIFAKLLQILVLA